MGRQRVSVTRESNTGRNQRFHDNYRSTDMTRGQFVKEINNGNYENYHEKILLYKLLMHLLHKLFYFHAL